MVHSPARNGPELTIPVGSRGGGGLVFYNSFGMVFDPISKKPLERRRTMARRRHAPLLVPCLVLAVAGSALAIRPPPATLSPT